MREALLWGVGAATLLGVGLGTTQLKEVVHPPVKPAGLDAHETHASSSLLGQFRTSVSSWLWLRTDLYLHNGVEMRHLTQQELDRGKTGVGSSDNHDEALHNDELIVTVIPSRERDFRGFFGDLDRATKAYKDMSNHGHNDPKTALPLFRLMTWVDPTFVPGWTTAAAVIIRDRTEEANQKALGLLREGLAANPNSVGILSEIGFVHVSRRKDLRTAAAYFEQARQAGRAVVERLDDEDQEALLYGYRWLGLIYRDLGRADSMREVLREGVQLFPDDPVLLRLLNPPPQVLSEQGQKAWQDAIQEELEGARADDHDHHHDHEDHHDHDHP